HFFDLVASLLFASFTFYSHDCRSPTPIIPGSPDSALRNGAPVRLLVRSQRQRQLFTRIAVRWCKKLRRKEIASDRLSGAPRRQAFRNLSQFKAPFLPI